MDKEDHCHLRILSGFYSCSTWKIGKIPNPSAGAVVVGSHKYNYIFLDAVESYTILHLL